MEHDIEVSGNFVRPYIYQAARTIYEEAQTKIKKLEEKGVIEKGESNLVSPMVCARKKDGRLRLSGDFQCTEQNHSTGPISPAEM